MSRHTSATGNLRGHSIENEHSRRQVRSSYPLRPVDEFLTVNEVAATLKLNPQAVRNWIDAR